MTRIQMLVGSYTVYTVSILSEHLSTVKYVENCISAAFSDAEL